MELSKKNGTVESVNYTRALGYVKEGEIVTVALWAL